MKRAVKAFVRLAALGSVHGVRGPDIYWKAYDFENERLRPDDRIVPCTITYDDGKQPTRACTCHRAKDKCTCKRRAAK